MSGKNPLGLSKEAQAYEGANIVLPPGGAAIISGKQNPPFPKPNKPVPTIAVNTASQQAFIQVAPGIWQTFGTSVNDFSTATTLTMIGNTTYLADNSSKVTFTLPALAPQGTTITVIGKGSGGWQINQLASQEIFQGANNTTAGTGGNVAGGQYATITIMSTDASAGLKWIVTAYSGTLTFT